MVYMDKIDDSASKQQNLKRYTHPTRTLSVTDLIACCLFLGFAPQEGRDRLVVLQLYQAQKE